jgi:hypothetical protein
MDDIVEEIQIMESCHYLAGYKALRICLKTEVPLARNSRGGESSAVLRKELRGTPHPRTTYLYLDLELWVLKRQLVIPLVLLWQKPKSLSSPYRLDPSFGILAGQRHPFELPDTMSATALSRPSASSDPMKVPKLPPRFPCSHCDKIFKRSEHRARHERSRKDQNRV